MNEVILNLQKNNVDVFCVTESWLSDAILNRILIFPGYEIIRKDRPVASVNLPAHASPRGGGVAIIHRKTLKVTTLPISSDTPALESLWVNVAGAGQRSATVGVFYRPPSQSVTAGLDELHDELRAALSRGRPTFCLGDANVDLLRENGPGVRQYRAFLDDLGLRQLVSTPTHLEPTPTLLDHVITNLASDQCTVSVLPDAIADHLTVVVETSFRKCRNRLEKFTIRPWKNVNWDAVCLDLLYIDWDLVREQEIAENKVSVFIDLWWHVLNQHCPLKTVNPRRRRSCPWIENNSEILELLHQRDLAFRAWRNFGGQELRDAYKLLKNRTKKVIACARRDYLCTDMLTLARTGGGG